MKKRQEERFCDAQEMLRALQDIHAIDGRYKKVVRSQKIVAAASIVLAIAGTATILLGTQRIGVERYAAYDALVRKGRTAAEEMHFDEAEQDLNQQLQSMMISWKRILKRRCFSIGRVSIRSASMLLKQHSPAH